jgi:hypothetical protein
MRKITYGARSSSAMESVHANRFRGLSLASRNRMFAAVDVLETAPVGRSSLPGQVREPGVVRSGATA